MMKELRENCIGEVFSYTFLIDHLQNYANPNGKITRLLKKRDIIRVKKGLYVFGKQYRRSPVNRAVLANLIYGPSYVSGHYALSHYGLIPELVETVTSMTTQRNKEFNTPFGHFEYQFLRTSRYSVGVNWLHIGNGLHCLFASPEKALADLIAKQHDLKHEKDVFEYLTDDLRVEETSLSDLDKERLLKIASVYRSPTVHLFNQLLARLS
jgi:hypothetical protein